MSAEIEINAPAARVWSILIDLSRYGEWNPMTPSVTGRLVEGQTLRLTAELGGFQRTQDQRVETVDPGRRLVWSGGLPGGLVRGTRTQTVQALGPERCRYRTDDRFKGPLASATRATMTTVLNARFRAVAEALRDRAQGWNAPTAHDGRWVVALGAGLLPPAACRPAVVEGRSLWVWRTEGGRLGAVVRQGGEHRPLVLGEQLHAAAGQWGVADPEVVLATQLGPLVLLWLHPTGQRPARWPRLEGAWSGEEDWRQWALQPLPVGAEASRVRVEEGLAGRTLVLDPEPAPRGSPGVAGARPPLVIGVAPPAPRSVPWVDRITRSLARA